jgi:peptide/nickel transport system substrate-binding protein
LSWQVFDQIYDTLLAFDDNGEVVANLAKEWTVSDDGLEATFVLNEGIVCHDGTPFDANDVKYTAERAIDAEENPSVTSGAWGPITSVEAVDDLTVKFTFEKPVWRIHRLHGGSLLQPDLRQCGRTRRRLWRQRGRRDGPLEASELDQRRRNRFREESPTIKTLVGPSRIPVRPISMSSSLSRFPEPQTRLAGLQTGEIEIIAEPPLEELEAIRSDDSLELYVAEQTGQNVFFEFTISRGRPLMIFEPGRP